MQNSSPVISAVTKNSIRSQVPPKRLFSVRVHSFILLFLFLALWQFGVAFFRVPTFIIPPVSDVVIALYQGLAISPFSVEGYWYHTFVTLTEVMSGFVIGGGIGVTMAMVISESQYIDDLIRPYINGLQSLPKVAIAPVIVMWMGYGLQSKIVIVVLLTFFPILVTSVAGFKSIEPERIDLLRSLSATRWQIFSKAKFPSALPYIFAGLDVAAALAVVGAIVGEFVGAQAGLGVMILQSDAQLDTGASFAVFIILALMGVALNAVLRQLRRHFLSWMPSQGTSSTSLL